MFADITQSVRSSAAHWAVVRVRLNLNSVSERREVRTGSKASRRHRLDDGRTLFYLVAFSTRCVSPIGNDSLKESEMLSLKMIAPVGLKN